MEEVCHIVLYFKSPLWKSREKRGHYGSLPGPSPLHRWSVYGALSLPPSVRYVQDDGDSAPQSDSREPGEKQKKQSL